MGAERTFRAALGVLWRVGFPLAVFALLWLLTLAVRRDALETEQVHTRALFQQVATQQIALLRQEVALALQQQVALANHLRFARHTTDEEFAQFIAPLLNRHPPLRALGLAVPGEGGLVLEHGVGERVAELLPPATRMAELLARADSRGEPVSWVERSGGSSRIGSVLALKGVGAGGAGRAYVLMNLDVERLVDSAIGRGRQTGMRDLGLELVDAELAPLPLYRSGELPAQAALSYAESIRFGDRGWLAIATPMPGYFSLDAGESARTLTLVGLALATLGALTVTLLQGAAAAVRRQVRRQTAELARANQQLSDANAALQVEVDNRMRSEVALWESTSLQRAILDGADYAIFSTDPAGVIQVFNPAAERMFGWHADEVVGQASALVMFDDEDLAHWAQTHAEHGFAAVVAHARHVADDLGELNLHRKDGSRFPASLSMSPLHDAAREGVRGYLGIVADVSARKASEGRIRFLAHYDSLTELPNRSLLNLRLGEALLAAERSSARVAVLFVDLDRFKYVNDSLGHQAGDQLLQAVSRRFVYCVREQDTVSRTGGDEFVVVLPDLPNRERAAQVAERVVEALQAPFEVRGQMLTVTPSIGIALYPEDGHDAETLIKHADAAMYAAKEQGRNTWRFFESRLTTRVNERLLLENRLRRALERGEFSLHYQPQVNVATGELVGLEALLRWHDSEAGQWVPPSRFIPVAEDCGLIVPIGNWVLATACAQHHRWITAGLLDVPMAVNLSARQFDQPDLLERIGQVLGEAGLAARHLELELTEGLVMRDPERSSQTLQACQALGVKVAVDDFGTGYSSLAYLKRFPIDRLKIDRSFITDIVSEEDDAAIVQTIIAMAHTLGLGVLAEGVESAAQLRLLRRWHCDAYQGFLCARPMTATQLESMLRGLRAAGISVLQHIEPVSPPL